MLYRPSLEWKWSIFWVWETGSQLILFFCCRQSQGKVEHNRGTTVLKNDAGVNELIIVIAHTLFTESPSCHTCIFWKIFTLVPFRFRIIFFLHYNRDGDDEDKFVKNERHWLYFDGKKKRNLQSNMASAAMLVAVVRFGSKSRPTTHHQPNNSVDYWSSLTR